MTLPANKKLGPYEILSQIGAGGMGEVYRARDTRLDRTVAIKILPAELSQSATLKQRFEREARAISSLSHQHICTLYDVGSQDGIDYLVMEYLEGQTLTDRLSKGPLPLEEVLRSALEMVSALARAHRQGIVHRDLKPGNVMLTKAGVKLLDFGLAKLKKVERGNELRVERHAPTGMDSQLSTQTPLNSDAAPTVKDEITKEGTILGTLQYMAPEQVEGREADARTDIFAFGTVLYEMATGKKAFAGKTRANLMAAILEREPEPISRSAPLIPPSLNRVIVGCLAKDPEERWQTAHDLKLQLKWILEGGSEAGLPQPVAVRRKRREQAAWALALLLAVSTGVATFTAWKNAFAKPRAVRFQVPAPTNTVIESLALSPDGGKLAMVCRAAGRKTQLWVRSLDSLEARPIQNTDGASSPFWSPDGTSIGFFAERKLKKVALHSLEVRSLCDAPSGFGATWGRKGMIVFQSGSFSPLHTMPASGGVSIGMTNTAYSGRYPSFLPDGEHFLFWSPSVSAGGAGTGEVWLGSLDSTPPRFLFPSTERARYAAGHLLYRSEGVLWATPFDPDSQQIIGPPVRVADAIARSSSLGTGPYSASADGTLVYISGATEPNSQMTWYNLRGEKLGVIGPLADHHVVGIVPDGKYAWSSVRDAKGNHDLWRYHIESGSRDRLTRNPGDERNAVWSPDFKSVVFNSKRKGVLDLYVKQIGSFEEETLLFESGEDKRPISWSRDGKSLLFMSHNTARTKAPQADIWKLRMEKETNAEPFLVTESDERNPRLSPNQQWVLYQQSKDGPSESEVYAVSFAHPVNPTRISKEGGVHPRWSPDGKKVYYLDFSKYIVSAEVRMEGTELHFGAVERLFEIQSAGAVVGSGGPPPFDIHPDGKRFLVNEAVENTNSVPATVVLNWTREFQKK